MGLFTRLIGKIAGSGIGKKLIGKTAHVVKAVIGKIEHAKHWAEENHPELLHAAETMLEDLGVAHDAKAVYHAAKELADVGEAYAEGKLKPGKVKKRIKDLAIETIKKY